MTRRQLLAAIPFVGTAFTAAQLHGYSRFGGRPKNRYASMIRYEFSHAWMQKGINCKVFINGTEMAEGCREAYEAEGFVTLRSNNSRDPRWPNGPRVYGVVRIESAGRPPETPMSREQDLKRAMSAWRSRTRMPRGRA